VGLAQQSLFAEEELAPKRYVPDPWPIQPRRDVRSRILCPLACRHRRALHKIAAFVWRLAWPLQWLRSDERSQSHATTASSFAQLQPRCRSALGGPLVQALAALSPHARVAALPGYRLL